MMPYFITIALSCFCTHMATRNAKNRYGTRYYIWSFIAIIIPCLLAGARDVTIGTDVAVYVSPIFNYALRCRSVWDLLSAWSMEPLYLILLYVVSRFSDQLFWALFFVELICVLFVYKALKDNNLGRWTWLGMLVFFLTIYGYSLNIMRQCMAMSICFYAFKFVKEGAIKKFLLCILLAMGFQYTAAIGILVYPIYMINAGELTKNKSLISKLLYKYHLLINVLIIAALCSVVAFARQIIILISNITGRFSGQVIRITATSDINYLDLLVKTTILAVLCIFAKNLIKKNGDFEFLIIITISAIILMQVGAVNGQAGRISLYFYYYILLMIPYTIDGMAIKSNRIIFTSVLIFLMFVYFYVGFIMYNWGQIYPYTSRFLGIG